jgi:hypothetical protein
MKHTTVITGLCIACLLITCILVAGCTSQNAGNAPGQTPVPQPAVTGQSTGPATPAITYATAGTPQGNPDVGLVSDNAGDQLGSDHGNVTMASETPAVPPANNTEQNVTSESQDLGDILP